MDTRDVFSNAQLSERPQGPQILEAALSFNPQLDARMLGLQLRESTLPANRDVQGPVPRASQGNAEVPGDPLSATSGEGPRELHDRDLLVRLHYALHLRVRESG
jgi:hypothetical protein